MSSADCRRKRIDCGVLAAKYGVTRAIRRRRFAVDGHHDIANSQARALGARVGDAGDDELILDEARATPVGTAPRNVRSAALPTLTCVSWMCAANAPMAFAYSSASRACSTAGSAARS